MMNVLLVTDWDADTYRFSEVARELRSLGIRARIAHDVEPKLKHRLWSLGSETKVVSMFPLQKFTLQWAEIWQQLNYDKIQEYRLLERAGIPIPKWVPVLKGKDPDLSGFSDYVVVKPAMGWKGAFVRIMRRDRVNYRPITTDAMPNVVNSALIAQEYIHTGAWPINHRVGTVFGEPIFMFRSIANGNRMPFIGSTFDANFFVGRSVVATAKGCSRDAEVPEDVIELAREAHRKVFPNIPLLGFDIVRDMKTGKLFVLEVNAFGRTYSLAPDASKQFQDEFGFDLHKQFGGIKAVTRGIYNRLFWKDQNQNGSIQIPEKEKLETCAAL